MASSSVQGVICLFSKKFIKSFTVQVLADFDVSTPVLLEIMLDAAIASNIRFLWTTALLGCTQFGPPFLLIVFVAVKKHYETSWCFRPIAYCLFFFYTKLIQLTWSLFECSSWNEQTCSGDLWRYVFRHSARWIGTGRSYLIENVSKVFSHS